jgi:hypothetical protein
MIGWQSQAVSMAMAMAMAMATKAGLPQRAPPLLFQFLLFQQY